MTSGGLTLLCLLTINVCLEEETPGTWLTKLPWESIRTERIDQLYDRLHHNTPQANSWSTSCTSSWVPDITAVSMCWLVAWLLYETFGCIGTIVSCWHVNTLLVTSALVSRVNYVHLQRQSLSEVLSLILLSRQFWIFASFSWLRTDWECYHQWTWQSTRIVTLQKLAT